MSKQASVSTDFDIANEAYLEIFEEAKQKILSTRIQVARAASRQLFSLYWWLGQKIAEAQEKYNWGKSVIERLSIDLKRAFGGTSGFSPQNLWYMRQIYQEYKNHPILQQLVGEIPWGQNLVILSEVKDNSAREYYLRGVIEHGWTRNVLVLQIQ